MSELKLLTIQKKCSKCGEIKPINSINFSKGKNKCKGCVSIRNKEKYEKNKEWYKNYNKVNKEKIKIKSSKHYNKNKDKLKKRNLDYYNNNKEKVSEYYHENKDAISEKMKVYREENNEKFRKYNLKYSKDRRKEDPRFKVEDTLRKRIAIAIKRQYTKKAYSSVELLGCTPKEAREHIEKQFVEGMTWDNYPEWHVDHIIPCSFFDLTKPEQQKECFNYTNLQPLWAIDNMKKGCKLNYQV